MAKSQKNNSALNEKQQVIRKSGKRADKSSAKMTEPKAIKRIAGTSEKSTADSKQSLILALLQRSIGATIDEMAKSTGWQRHSIHGMMSGVLKKKLGLTVTSEKEERGRVYHITGNVSRL